MEPLAHAASLAAVLLAFAMLVSGRSWPLLYAAQCVMAALVAASAAVLSADPWPGVSALVLLSQAAAIPRLLRGAPRIPAAAPVVAACAGLALTALAASLGLPDGFAPALAVMLLGLLDASRARDAAGLRFGVLLLLNGAAVAGPAPLGILALAASAAIVACAGLPRWDALR